MRRLRRIVTGTAIASLLALTMPHAAEATPRPLGQQWWFAAWAVNNKIWPVTQGQGVTVAVAGLRRPGQPSRLLRRRAAGERMPPAVAVTAGPTPTPPRFPVTAPAWRAYRRPGPWHRVRGDRAEGEGSSDRGELRQLGDGRHPLRRRPRREGHQHLPRRAGTLHRHPPAGGETTPTGKTRSWSWRRVTTAVPATAR